MPADTPKLDTKKAFVIHGRNMGLRDALYAFLRSLGLEELTFDRAADLYVGANPGNPPYVGEIVRFGINHAQAMIALISADECIALNPNLGHETQVRWGARPNVWFEAGIAFQLAPGRLVIAVEPGAEIPTDAGGILHCKLENSIDARRILRNRLKAIGCAIDEHSDIWSKKTTGGDFEAARVPRPRVKEPLFG